MKPDSVLIEIFAIPPATRVKSNTCHELANYIRDDGRAKTMDLVVRFHLDGTHSQDEDLLLCECNQRTGTGQIIFPYVCHDKPNVNVLEVQHYILNDKRTRVWQRFESDELAEIMVIQERCVHRREQA